VLPKNTHCKTWWECEKGDRWEAAYHNIQQGRSCPICSNRVPKEKKDYHKLAKSRGFKWISEVLPKDTHAVTLWECGERHRWKARYSDIQQGSGCPVCSGLVKKTEKDYHELAKSRWFKWVDIMLPKNVHIKTWWECKKKHCWEAEYGNIKKGTGCPVCNIESLRNTELDYHRVVENKHIIWFGVELPKNVNTKTQWKCLKCNYVWKARYSDIQQGSGCPFCTNRVPKTEQSYHDLAKSRGFKWVGGLLPKTVLCLTLWECGIGHRWETKYNYIQQGSGCPVCSGNVKKTKNDYYMLAESRSFKWLGIVLPKNTSVSTWWECEKGDKWLASYHNIQQGSGCPICKDLINGAPVSKPQRKLNNILCGYLNYLEGRYRIDVAIMRRSQKIAVEYDCQYWHEGNEEQDTKRDNFLISCGWKVLHVRSGHLLPTRKQIKKAIINLLEIENKIHNLYLEDWK